jgi:hypothetical protein
MIAIKIQIFERSRIVDTYKISKSNIEDGITNTIEYLQQKGWLSKNVCDEEAKEH